MQIVKNRDIIGVDFFFGPNKRQKTNFKTIPASHPGM